MARGWGDVALHTIQLEAIRVGTCAQWSAHNVPHWECQTLQCGTCTTHPVLAEEAPEDAGAEKISFHVYECKVLLCQDGKECCHLEIVQKKVTIGKFHCLFYVPALGHSRYHMTSYRLAVGCRVERHTIMRSSVSLHCNYGKRLGLSFNEEIQSRYYQNTLVSVEVALLEWVDVDGGRHTRYFSRPFKARRGSNYAQYGQQAMHQWKPTGSCPGA
jgi:hypothetical protein